MTLLSLALKGALVLSLASIAAHLLRQGPAAARHAVWVAAFIALLALPALTTFGPSIELALLPERMETPAPEVVGLGPEVAPLAPIAPLPPVAPMAPVGVPLEMEAPAPPLPPLPPAAPVAPLAQEIPLAPVVPAALPSGLAPISLPRALLMVWAGGGLLVLLGWMLPLLAASHLVRRARPETSGTWLDALEHARLLSDVEGPVRLLRSDRLDVPVAWGWGTPAVVLPADADEWNDARREAVLLHELAHLARGDAQTQVLAQVAVALHWFDPLAWWAYSQMLVEREHACDDAVLRGGARPSDYAGHLVEIARGLRRRPTALAGFAPMARHSRLEGRVRSILGDHQRSALTRIRVAAVALGALALTLPLAACQLTSRTAENPAPAPRATPAASPTPRPVAHHAETEREMERAERALAEAEADLADLDLDLDVQMEDLRLHLDDLDVHVDIEPMLARAREQIEEARRLHINVDVDWDEIEADLAEVQVDYDEALAEAHAALADVDWETSMEEALREAKIDIKVAMEELRLELADVERENAEARREADRERRQAREEARRAREEAQREADRERNRLREEQQRQRDQNRQREEARRESEARNQQTGIQGVPSTPPGYSYAITSRDGNVVMIAGTGARAWTASLESWRVGLDAVASQAASAQTTNQITSVRRALDGMKTGLDGIERSGNGWARSTSDRRLVTERVSEARAALATATRRLDSRASCDQG